MALYGPCGGGGGGGLLALYGPCGDGAVAGLKTPSAAPKPEKSNGTRIGFGTTTVHGSRKRESGAPKCAGTPDPNSLTTACLKCDHVGVQGEGARGERGGVPALSTHNGNPSCDHAGGKGGVHGDLFLCRGERLPLRGELLLPRGERKGGVIGGRKCGAGSSNGLPTASL